MRSYPSSSTVRPEEWDKTSARGIVYHNKNIVVVEGDNEIPMMYHYDVDEYELDEFVNYQAEKLAQLQAQNAELTEQNSMLADCLLEMSEVVYA